jgi:anaerobic selenocysteine-containing dehydrogenase
MSTASKKHFSTCTLCEAMCGIEVTTLDKQIVSIVGDKANPFSQGHVCPKAIALKDLYEDPNRIKRPLKKSGNDWVEISWQQAFDEVADKLFSIQAEHGDDAVGIYLGNPNAHNMGSILFGPYFYRALKTNNRYSATSVDQLPHHIVSRQLFGHQQQIPIPDIDHCNYFLIIGGNPLASNGSIMTVPMVKKRLQAIQKRSGKVVVIDPKRSETAEIASEHHFIKPGSDVLLLLSMLHSLLSRGLDSPGKLTEYVPELPLFKSYVEGYSAEYVSAQVGIEATEIHRIVTEFCAAKTAVCYGRMGASVQVFGTLTQYLIMMFNILTGNLDKRGGMMFTQPAADTLPHSGRGSLAKSHSRVRGLPSFAGEFPVACLAEEITTPGNGQIRAMVVGAGNPIIATPNVEQLDKAFSSLDYMVAIDFFVTETSRHADIILPPVTGLERDHYDLVFHKFAVRNFAKFSPALFEPEPDSLTDWQIYLSLAERLEQKRGSDTSKYESLWAKQPKGMVDDLLQSGRYADSQHQLSLETLLANPHGIDLGPLQPELPDALFHNNKQIQLALTYFMGDLSRVNRYFFEAPTNSDSKYVLIGRRHLKSNNSWLHNSRRLMRGKSRCTAQINPQDAGPLGIENGDQVTVMSRVGKVTIEAEITDRIMPGVISIPHGFGHNKKGMKLDIAEQYAGVNTNILTDDLLVDELSGNAVLNGVPVDLQLAQ